MRISDWSSEVCSSDLIAAVACLSDQAIFDNWRTFIDTIQIVNIDDLDFRHLVLLDALLRRRSVSAAARDLDLPHPTASHGLARLQIGSASCRARVCTYV